MIELLPLFMILSLVVFLFSGYPVALVLTGVTTVFTALAIGLDLMSVAKLQLFTLRSFALLADSLIFPAVVPLILMGVILARSGQIESFMGTLSHLLRRVPGSLPITVLVVGILIAPSAGLIGAAVGTLTIATLPTLLAQRYSASVATSAVAAAGTLGVILPPAVMLFFLADLAELPILETFTGVLLPAGLLFALYVVYFVIRGRSAPAEVQIPQPTRLTLKSMISILGPIFVVGAVLASIATGWATPTQSGAIGAFAAFCMMILTRPLTWNLYKKICVETATIVAMVFLIILAANAFTLVFRILDGDEMVEGFLFALNLGTWGTLLFVLAVVFILGFFIDWLEIVVISLPLFMPVLVDLDFSQHVGSPLMINVWLATLFALVLQTSFVTPPFGFALFFLRGSAPPGVSMADIYRGAVPIVGLQLVVLALVLLFPWLATAIASGLR
ncbi:TRAP transporter large permease subunit [Primorskyibacter aestuariivivens]|jgi:tripartite ATP-independent transporter DctM subunit|uniref:TRAP transporter large permease n=1 Tax=Primorskyibacter aestuariivivens TaxID=1888912 RepID=UPI0023010AA1|nr:TRAP transporter large permease subunit [Primorskyibacter aestuariivivens]MDA7429170.1 TRAP transporter large permease subunit [Primorskyibacter aestuariivivens]